jgi:hypothetical protein
LGADRQLQFQRRPPEDGHADSVSFERSGVARGLESRPLIAGQEIPSRGRLWVQHYGWTLNILVWKL